MPVRAEGLPSWFVAPQSPLISPRSDQHRLDQELKAGRCCRPAPLRGATRCTCWAPGVVGRMLGWFDGSTSSLPRARVSQEGGFGTCVPSRVAGLAGCTAACTNTVHWLARGADGGPGLGVPNLASEGMPCCSPLAVQGRAALPASRAAIHLRALQACLGLSWQGTLGGDNICKDRVRQGNGWSWLTQAGRRRFGVVRSLLRVLEDGQAAKDVVDVAIDANSAMQNLREAIAGAQPRLP